MPTPEMSQCLQPSLIRLPDRTLHVCTAFERFRKQVDTIFPHLVACLILLLCSKICAILGQDIPPHDLLESTHLHGFLWNGTMIAMIQQPDFIQLVNGRTRKQCSIDCKKARPPFRKTAAQPAARIEHFAAGEHSTHTA